MVVRNCTLPVETAVEEAGGRPVSFFVRGGHFTDAFMLAVSRVVDGDYAWRLNATREQFMTHVIHSYWVEVAVAEDEYDDYDGLQWEYHDTTADAEGSFPVTNIWMSAVESLYVPVCRACLEGDHESCDKTQQPTEVPMYHITGRRDRPLTDQRWQYNPSRF